MEAQLFKVISLLQGNKAVLIQGSQPSKSSGHNTLKMPSTNSLTQTMKLCEGFSARHDAGEIMASAF